MSVEYHRLTSDGDVVVTHPKARGGHMHTYEIKDRAGDATRIEAARVEFENGDAYFYNDEGGPVGFVGGPLMVRRVS